MKKRLLWLDDYRNPYSKEIDWMVFSPIGRNVEIFWVRTYNEFVDWISLNGLPDGICFDHDLGIILDPNAEKIQMYKGVISDYSISHYDDEEKTGYDCAKWLVEYCIENKVDLPLYSIISANPVGKENIDKLLKNFIKNREISSVTDIHD